MGGWETSPPFLTNATSKYLIIKVNTMPRGIPKVKKESIETLQENYLTGPANEPISEVREQMQEDAIIVFSQVPQHEKVIFRNQRDPGYPLDFHYASKTHPFKQYTLIDGKEYTLPSEVVRNLEGCKEYVYKHRKTSEGIPEIYTAGYKSHFVCERAA